MSLRINVPEPDEAAVLKALLADETIEDRADMLAERRAAEGSATGHYECIGCSWTTDAGRICKGCRLPSSAAQCPSCGSPTTDQCPKCNATLKPVAELNANAAKSEEDLRRRAARRANLLDQTPRRRDEAWVRNATAAEKAGKEPR